MHDTTVDRDHGEVFRCGLNMEELCKLTGFPKEELSIGLKPAIDEFLSKNQDWVVHKVYTNNNGLTVLMRV